MAEALLPPRRNRLLLAQWSELLENDSFRRFYLMRLASTTAINGLTYALLVFTVRHSDSALATGGLLMTVLVPSAMLGAFAGVVVDHVPRGLVLFLSNLLRAVLMFVLIGAKDALPSLYLVALAIGIIAQFAVPAEGAVLPHIVRRDRLAAAASFLSLGGLATQVAGMLVLAPVLLKTTDGDPLLFLLMALFAFAAAVITVIPQFHFTSLERRQPISISSARRQFAEGWMTLARDPVAYLALILTVIASVSTLVIATMLPRFSTRVLDIEPENIVFVLAPVALGIYAGLRSVDWLARRVNKMVAISGAYVLMAGALVALGLVPSAAAEVVSLDPLGLFGAGPLDDQAARVFATVLFANCYGFGMTLVGTLGKVLLNERVPHDMQGRIFAAQAVLSNLAAIPPVLAAGLLADSVGVEPVLVVTGVAALAAAAWSHAQGSRAVPAHAT